MKVYISGPISTLSEEEFKANFKRASSLVANHEHEPVNPLEVAACEDNSCGSTVTFANGEYQHTWQCYVRHDIISLLKCDAICMMPGWLSSRGARVEKYVAENVGMSVLFIDPLWRGLSDKEWNLDY